MFIIGLLSFIASIFSLFVAGIALRLQLKANKDLKIMEDNIDKLENNIGEVSKITSETQNNVNKTHFKIERTIAFNKYSKLESINTHYLDFIRPLFDEESADIEIKITPDLKLNYEISFLKNDANIPIKRKIFESDYYIIKIISPSIEEILRSGFLEKYKNSPIKEGEYYLCRFDDLKCMWFLEQTPKKYQTEHEDKMSYSFSIVNSFSSQNGECCSANESMGYSQNNYPGNNYELIDQFSINENGSLFEKNLNNPFSARKKIKLFQKEKKYFFIIHDSPLKKIYILKTCVQTQAKKFIVFENLRGHIIGDKFMENFKDRVFKKIKQSDLSEKTMDENNFKKMYHIKKPL